MKRLLATALLGTVAALALAAGSASAACTPPYCTAPVAATSGASNITANSAALSGTVQIGNASSGSWQIQLDNGSGTFATLVASGTVGAAGSVSGTASGLTANTTYSYRIAVTTAGGTHWSAPSSFTTAGEPSTNPDTPGDGGNQGGGNNGGNGEPSGNPKKEKPGSLSLEVTPKRVTALPVKYTASGALEVEDASRCADGGTVALRFKQRGSGVDLDYEAQLKSDCSYSKTVRIPNREITGENARVVVSAKFTGNDGIRKIKADDVTVRYEIA
jgi:hypothetical protein